VAQRQYYLSLTEKGEKSMEVLALEIKATILRLVVILSGAKPCLVQEQRSVLQNE